MNKLSSRQSKIPIAITRVRKGGAVAKLESNLKQSDYPLKRKVPVTSHTPRTVKKVPNFKKLHKQFEAHIARGKVKKKPPTVFVKPLTRTNKENVPQTKSTRCCNNNRKSRVYKQDEVTLVSIPSVAMVTKVNKGHHNDDDDFMEKFKELCEQYQTGYHQRPIPHQRQLQNNTGQSGQLDTSLAFKSLVEKAVYSQHHKCTMRHRPLVSPGYTRGMREASEVMLRSVKRFCQPQQHYHQQLDDVRANLADQLDSCSDWATDSDSNFMLQSCGRRRNTMVLRSRELDS